MLNYWSTRPSHNDGPVVIFTQCRPWVCSSPLFKIAQNKIKFKWVYSDRNWWNCEGLDEGITDDNLSWDLRSVCRCLKKALPISDPAGIALSRHFLGKLFGTKDGKSDPPGPSYGHNFHAWCPLCSAYFVFPALNVRVVAFFFIFEMDGRTPCVKIMTRPPTRPGGSKSHVVLFFSHRSNVQVKGSGKHLTLLWLSTPNCLFQRFLRYRIVMKNNLPIYPSEQT